MNGPHECLMSILRSPYPTDADKANAKVLMRHINRLRKKCEARGEKIAELESKLVENLPKRLTRDQAEPLCELLCRDECFGDCECNDKVQEVWEKLRRRLMNND